jgi:hypothetical protein
VVNLANRAGHAGRDPFRRIEHDRAAEPGMILSAESSMTVPPNRA